MASPASKVFISYGHDSDLHKQRVLLLADRLNGDGLDCRLDQYIEDQPPADWRGWKEESDFQYISALKKKGRSGRAAKTRGGAERLRPGSLSEMG